MGSGSVSFSERTVGRAEPKVKKPPLRFTWCGEGAGAATGALGAATGALEAATGALDAATGVWAATGTLWTPAANLEAGTGVLAGAGWAAAAKVETGILCLALAAEPKVCASSKKVLSPATLLVLVEAIHEGYPHFVGRGGTQGRWWVFILYCIYPYADKGLGSQSIPKFSGRHL